MKPIREQAMNGKDDKKVGVKAKLIHEMKEMLVIFLYLAFFFCAFTTYRMLVMKEMGASYFHYGFALIKALVLAKVILLGQYARLAKVFEDRPSIAPTLYKVMVFSLFTLCLKFSNMSLAVFSTGRV